MLQEDYVKQLTLKVQTYIGMSHGNQAIFLNILLIKL